MTTGCVIGGVVRVDAKIHGLGRDVVDKLIGKGENETKNVFGTWYAFQSNVVVR